MRWVPLNTLHVSFLTNPFFLLLSFVVNFVNILVTNNLIKKVASIYQRPKSMNCLVLVGFALKNYGGWVGGSKKIRFFEKKKQIYTASWLPSMLHATCSSNHQYIIKIKMKELVYEKRYKEKSILFCAHEQSKRYSTNGYFQN